MPIRLLSRRADRSATSITVETRLDAATAERFYALYLEAFGPLRSRAAARQVLHRDEFFAEMTDPRVWKYLAWDEAGRPCGLTTLTRDLETVPWISPDYFAAHYPEHSARRAVYYLGFTLVDPRNRRRHVFQDMISAVVARLQADDAVCGYDICAYNNEVMRFADNIEVMLRRAGEVTVESLDRQTYYCADFSGAGAER